MNGYGNGYRDALNGHPNRAREMRNEEEAWYYKRGYKAGEAKREENGYYAANAPSKIIRA